MANKKTIMIDGELHKKIKKEAVSRTVILSEFVEKILNDFLLSEKEKRKKKKQ